MQHLFKKSADIFILVQSTHIAINCGIVEFVNWVLENQKLEGNFFFEENHL
jgi:hypothetical protein